MIKTHPTELMLRAFAADELPLPLAVGVSAHCELCPDCAARLKGCEEELARQYLEPADQPAAISETMPLELDAMLAGILQQPVASPPNPANSATAPMARAMPRLRALPDNSRAT